MEDRHRLLPHTADIRVEAWGATRAACLSQMVVGIVDSFVDRAATGSLPSTKVPVQHGGATDRDLAVWLVEEVLWLLDTQGVVPVSLDLVDTDGGLRGSMQVVAGDLVEVIGAPPKAVSFSDLVVERVGDGWHGLATIDV